MAKESCGTLTAAAPTATAVSSVTSKLVLEAQADKAKLLLALKKVKIFQYCKYGVCRSKVIKVISFQSWRSQEKVCRPAPAPLELLGPDLSSPWVKSLPKFDGWYFLSPLTNRPQIFSNKRYDSLQNCVKSLRR